MSCIIKRNEQGTEIVEVLAPNGKKSILFSDIQKIMRTQIVDYTEADTKALELYSQTLTPAFKKWSEGSEFVDVNGEPLLKFSTPLALRTVYQGFKGERDTRDFNYYAVNRAEAADYGENIEELNVDTTGFLKKYYIDDKGNRGDWTAEFNQLNREWMEMGNESFDILDNSPKGIKNQTKFFEFLKSKGYRGYDQSAGDTTADSNYLVTFDKVGSQDYLKAASFYSGKLNAGNNIKVKSLYNKGLFDPNSNDVFDQYNTRLEEALIDFLKGLNVDVRLDGDAIINAYKRRTGSERDILALTDLLNKIIVASKNRTYDTLPSQAAYIIYQLLGKKSMISKMLWFNIRSWSRYNELYDLYTTKAITNLDNKDIRYTNNQYEEDVKSGEINVIDQRDYFNAWAHRQVIYDFIAMALKNNFDQKQVASETRENIDYTVDYFKQHGIANPYAKVKKPFDKLVKSLLKIIRDLQVKIKGIFRAMDEQELNDLVLDITTDVFEKRYTKWLRGIRKEGDAYYTSKGEKLVLKEYKDLRKNDPYGMSIVDYVVTDLGAALTGSASARKYVPIFRPKDETFHDIDFIIDLDRAKKEEVYPKLKKKIDDRNLSGENVRDSQFVAKVLMPIVQQMSWYRNMMDRYNQKGGSIVLKNAFIGLDHAEGETITIQMTHVNSEGVKYELDFFLRTAEGSYPLIFDNVWLDWKQIFEAKILTGRAKDMRDLILFPRPYVMDGYEMGFIAKNKGYRAFDFADEPLSLSDVVEKVEEQEEVFTTEDIVNRQNKAAVVSALQNMVSKMTIATGGVVNAVFLADEAEAIELTKNAKNPYRPGDKAFFYKGSVYFVTDLVNVNDVVHEFMHPILLQIKEENPELFENLYNELKNTPEGAHIIAGVKESPYSKEEALVQAFTKMYMAMDDTRIPSPRPYAIEENDTLSIKFRKFAKKFLFLIKKAFRNVFGRKIKIEKLSPKTTIVELVDMINAGNQVEIKLNVVTDEDVVRYQEDVSEFIDVLKDLDKNELITDIQNTMRFINDHYARLKSDENLVSLKAALTEDEGELYEKMKQIMGKTEAAAQILTGKAADVEATLKSYVRTLLEIDKVQEIIVGQINNIMKQEGDQQTLAALDRYQGLVKGWQTRARDILRMLNRNVEDFSTEHPLSQLLSKIQQEAKSIEERAIKYKTNVVANALMDVWEPMNRSLRERKEREIKRFKQGLEKARGQKTIDYWNEKIKESEEYYENKILDKEKFIKYLTGEIAADGAGYWMNSMLENYTGSVDPATGSFAVWLKNEMTNAQTNAQRLSNQFLEELAPHLEKLGYGQTLTKKFISTSEKMIFMDIIPEYVTTAFVNEEGKVVQGSGERTIKPFEAWTFLNEFKHYKYAVPKMYEDLKVLRKEYFSLLENNEDESLVEDALEKWKAKSTEVQKHLNTYFIRPMKSEYYEIRDDIMKTPEGEEAILEMDEALDAIRNIQRNFNDELDEFQNSSTLKVAWEKYSELYSLYDNKGIKKKGIALKKAEALQEYREKSKKYRQWEPRPGYFQNSYNNFINKWESWYKSQNPYAEPDVVEAAKKEASDQWILNNTRVKIKGDEAENQSENFWAVRRNILDNIADILKKLRSRQKDKDSFPEMWEQIIQILSERRDKDGQPVGDNLTEEQIQRINSLQQTMEDMKEEINVLWSGLDATETKLYEELKKKKEKRTAKENEQFQELVEIKVRYGLKAHERRHLKNLFKTLDEIQSKEPTEYYVSMFNKFWERTNDKDNPGLIEIIEENADELFKDGKIGFAKANFPEELDAESVNNFPNWSEFNKILNLKEAAPFKEWFLMSNFKKKVFQKKGPRKEVWVRNAAWSVTRPTDAKFYHKAKYVNYNDEVLDITDKEKNFRVPVIQFEKRNLKMHDLSKGEMEDYKGLWQLDKEGKLTSKADKEAYAELSDKVYATGYNPVINDVEYEVGVHIDPTGKFLPKSHEEMKALSKAKPELFNDQPYNLYINMDYVEMDKSSDLFKTMEVIKKYHLKFQDDVETSRKLGLEIPRYRQDNFEYIYDAFARGNLTAWANGLWQRMVKSRDEFDQGLNLQTDYSLILETSMFTGNKPVPLTGKYFLEAKQVSKDVVGGVLKHMMSVQKYKALTDTSPLAKAIKEIVGESKGASEARTKAINAMYEVNWEGKRLTGVLAGQSKGGAFANKAVSNLLSLAAWSFFAGDIHSALKNSISQNYQWGLEASAGKYLKYKDFVAAKPQAYEVMREISMTITSKRAKPLAVQLVEVFDALVGEFEKDVGDSVSRSMLREFVNLKTFMSHRKWAQSVAMLNGFFGMMKFQKVEITDAKGEKKMISYDKAWELDENRQIKLKDGIDKKWDIGGKEFLLFKNRYQEVSNLNQGAYADQDKAQIERIAVMRSVMFLKQFFPKMFINRFGMMTSKDSRKGFLHPKFKIIGDARYNPALMDVHRGFYIEALDMIQSAIEQIKAGVFITDIAITPDQRHAIIKIAMDYFKIWLISLGFMMLGWDADDPDRISKMKARSGALPSPLTDEEWSKNFNLKGWLHNHLILLLMEIETEAVTFIPFPGFGLKEYVRLINSSSIAIAPTLETYTKLIYHLRYMIVDSYSDEPIKRAYYQRDVGALNRQQEGERKIWMMLYKMIGIKGKTIDPSTAVKNYDLQRKRV